MNRTAAAQRAALHKSLAELRELFMDMAFHYGAIHMLPLRYFIIRARRVI